MFENILKIDSVYKDCEYLNVKIKNEDRKVTLFSKFTFDYFDRFDKVYKRIKPYNHFLSGDVILFNKFKIMFPILVGTIVGIVGAIIGIFLCLIFNIPLEVFSLGFAVIAVVYSTIGILYV